MPEPEDEELDTWTGAFDQAMREKVPQNQAMEIANRVADGASYADAYRIVVNEGQGGGGVGGGGGSNVGGEGEMPVPSWATMMAESFRDVRPDTKAFAAALAEPGAPVSKMLQMAQDEQKAGRGGGGVSGVIGGLMDQYSLNRQMWQDQIASGQLTYDQAVDKFNRWLSTKSLEMQRADEAAGIGSEIGGALEKRAREYMPAETIAGLNAMMQKVTSDAGLPNVPIPVVPEGQFPDLWQVYRKSRTELGLPETLGAIEAPEVPGYEVPPPPGLPAGLNELFGGLLSRAGLDAGGGGGGSLSQGTIDDFISQFIKPNVFTP